MNNIFEEMTDEDFFSDKLKHIYFTKDVNNESVQELINKIREANVSSVINGIQVSPKPIAIHVSSYGGYVESSINFLSIFDNSRVPICTIIDNYSASAATILTINSPYRVMTEYSMQLIHQYSGFNYGRREEILNDLTLAEKTYNILINLYLKKTKIKKEELSEILRHDRWFDSKISLEKGMCDRIIKINSDKRKLKKEYDFPINILLKKTNFNNIYLNCDNNKEKIDLLLSQNNENIKPIIFFPSNIICNYGSNFMTEGLSLIPRIQCLKTFTFCVINSTISLDDFLPMLYCSKRYIYEHSTIVLNMIYVKNYSYLLSDQVYNTELMFNIIKKILKEKTKIPENIIKNINNEFIIFDAKDCVKYGLCDEIIEI